MALNIKPLFALDHPPVSFPEKPVELNTSSGELDMNKENLHKDHLREKEEDDVYHNEEALKKKLNLRRLNSI
ncbi:hypothetical protein [Halobacteriovorax sp. HLS]|uniref:hypothetical protein n=1 Tax=Halobacteriovorax sp. HLS TaxID=2234000 RepID=UPI000FDC9817|nr:hypothetical protein [Halobacteriovorax sp. HLS]